MKRKDRIIAFLKKVQPYIRTTTTVMAYGADMLEKKNIFSAVRFVSGLTCEVIEHAGRDEPAIPHTWHSVLTSSEARFLAEPLRMLPTEYAGDLGMTGKRLKAKLGGFEFQLYPQGTSDGNLYHLFYIDQETFKPADVDAAKKALYEYVRPYIPRQCRIGFDAGLRGVTMEEQPELPFHLTSSAVTCAKRLRRYLDKDVRRSLMLYGPPGYGKTNLVLAICAFLSLRYVEVESKAISLAFSYGHTNRLLSAVEALAPDILIVNDFDRIDKAQIFPFMDGAKRAARLVLYTSNVIGGFDTAMRRPERIDEFMRINRLDDEVVFSILGKHRDLYKQVHTWPAAYIVELCTRIEIEGTRDLQMWVKELQARQDEAMSEYGKEVVPGTPKRPKKLTVAAVVEGKASIKGVKANGHSSDPYLSTMDHPQNTDAKAS